MPNDDTPGVEPSEELRRVVTRFIEAMRDGDDRGVGNRLSRQPGFERFGSDPAEWWDDGEQAALVMSQQMRELGGGYPWRVIDEVRAYSEGNVGWASVKALFDSVDGDAVPLRMTCVLHLEHGEWKIVQAHTSVPSPNADHGFLLTTSVHQIAQSISETRPDLSASSAPDGTVTIGFTDIEDSTRLNGILGDQRWLEVLRAHKGVVQQITAEHGGSIVKNQGDGFMLAFPSARRGLRCAQSIQSAIDERFRTPGSPIRVRIGLHVGEALREEDDFFGHSVAFAARIAASADGGETVVSSLVHDLVSPTGEFVFDEPRVVELRGIPGSHRIYPLASASAAASS